MPQVRYFQRIFLYFLILLSSIFLSRSLSHFAYQSAFSIKKILKNTVFLHFLPCKLTKEPINHGILRLFAAKFYKCNRLLVIISSIWKKTIVWQFSSICMIIQQIKQNTRVNFRTKLTPYCRILTPAARYKRNKHKPDPTFFYWHFW